MHHRFWALSRSTCYRFATMKDSACTITVARMVYFERTNHVKDHVRIERILSTLFRCYTWSDLYGLIQICDSPRLAMYNVFFFNVHVH